MTLLEKAKAFKSNSRRAHINHDMIELALAWLKGDVSLKQVQSVLNKHPGSQIYSVITQILREAYNRGYLEIKEAK